jgi:C4-dicarboxylate-specific signal transduction histidine kinase
MTGDMGAQIMSRSTDDLTASLQQMQRLEKELSSRVEKLTSELQQSQEALETIVITRKELQQELKSAFGEELHNETQPYS